MYLEETNIKLSPIPRENLLVAGEKYYQIDWLKEKDKYVHGGNGIVFKLTDEQENTDYVIKFLKFPSQHRGDWKIDKRCKRFEREIEALVVARDNSLSNVVEIKFFDSINIDGLNFLYYVMQKCDSTLNEFMLNNGDDLDFFQKTLLCQKILQGIQGLHDYRIYHRDIKHDNIYFIGNEPYIGDLGLAHFQDSDVYINERGDLIGPTGWFSPEAINKYLVEKTKNKNKLDCKIDAKSEVFQLGKLFWYIYQGNIPIGQLAKEDFIPANSTIFELLYSMLMYSKPNRFDMAMVGNKLNLYLSSH